MKDGAFDHAAFEKAGDDFKGLRKELETFKSPADLAKSYHELRQLASKKGASLLEPLPKDASPELKAERQAAIRQALGVPETPEKYVIEKPKDLPDDLWDKAAVGEAAKLAHELGVPPEALQKLTEFEVNRNLSAQKAHEASLKEMWAGQEKLIREFAAKEGMDYGAAKTLAEKAAQRWGLDKDSPLMQNASVFALLTRIGKAQGESGLVRGDTADDNLAQHTPESALKSLTDIRENVKNPDYFAYWNRDPENPKKEKVHPDHDKVVEKVKRLSALAYANRQMRGGR